RLYALPVVEANRAQLALPQQPLQHRAPRLPARADIGRDLLGRQVAVGPVGADDAGGAALDPADGVQPRLDPAVDVHDHAAPCVERDALDRLGVIADRRNDQAAGDVEVLAGADGAAVDHLGAL